LACDIGVRKKPSAERGPNAITEIKQPHMMMTSGVRQPALSLTDCIVINIAFGRR
jgi:hypothetical protein